MPALDHAFCLFQHDIRNLHMPIGRLVEGRRYYFGAYTPAHLRRLFRPCINQRDTQVHLWLIFCHGVSNVFKRHGLTRFGLRYDKPTLTLADRCEKIHDPRGVITRPCKKLQPFGWEQWRQEIKWHTVAYFRGVLGVDGLYTDQREILLAFFGWPDAPAHGITRFEPKKFDL